MSRSNTGTSVLRVKGFSSSSTRLQVKPADQDEPNLWRAPGERLHECHSIAARNTEVEHQRVDVFEYRLRNGYG